MLHLNFIVNPSKQEHKHSLLRQMLLGKYCVRAHIHEYIRNSIKKEIQIYSTLFLMKNYITILISLEQSLFF